MTDNEIIKALERFPTGNKYKDRLLQHTIDLINRQKAEIERYQHSIKLLEKDVETAKSEAMKEFVER